MNEEEDCLSEEEVESAADEFRYERDLVSAQEMEEWLDRWGPQDSANVLSLDGPKAQVGLPQGMGDLFFRVPLLLHRNPPSTSK
jgi:hypothetical protein